MRYNVTTPDGPDTTDPHTIDWAERQARAVVPFGLDAEGLPVNPCPPLGAELVAGRGGLWHWGEAVAADAIVIAHDETGARYLLMVERSDGHGWALPGGMLDAREAPLTAAVRELAEETGLDLPTWIMAARPGRYVPDPRAGRHAWVVTVPHLAILPPGPLPTVAGADDAARAEWLPAGSYAALAEAAAVRGGQVYAAHVSLILDQLDQLDQLTSHY